MIIIAKRTNGEGTIYQRPNGLWCAELTIGYDSDGKRIKKSFSSMELEKLQKKLNDEKFKLNRNIITQKNDYTISEWVLFWLENYKGDLKSNTYDNYEYALNSHINNTVGHYKLDKIRPDAIQQLYNNMRKKNLSTSTIKKVHTTLNQAFEQAIKNELMYSNPCRAVTIPRIEKRKVISMSKSEQELFVKNCPDTTYGNFFQFALNTGMRCGEMVALTWSDIDFESKTIDINKTASTVKNRDEGAKTKTKIVIDSAKTEKSMRSIPMNKKSEKILLEQKDKKENRTFVFSSKVGTVLIVRNINRALNGVLDNADLPSAIGVHTLRHSFATRLLEKGANAKVVSDILGHSSIKVTLDIYSHVMPNMKKDVMGLLD